jgi:hypothetical protein
MIPPLLFSATKCGDSIIRGQAVDLFHASSRAECGWTSCMATSPARFVIDQEHGNSDTLIMAAPLRKRIRLEYVKFSSADRTACIKCWDCMGKQKSLVKGAAIPTASGSGTRWHHERDGAKCSTRLWTYWHPSLYSESRVPLCQ